MLCVCLPAKWSQRSSRRCCCSSSLRDANWLRRALAKAFVAAQRLRLYSPIPHALLQWCRLRHRGPLVALRAATLALGPYLGSGPWLRVCVCVCVCLSFYVCASVSPFTLPFVNCFLNFVKASKHTHTHTRGTHTHTHTHKSRHSLPARRRVWTHKATRCSYKIFYGFLYWTRFYCWPALLLLLLLSPTVFVRLTSLPPVLRPSLHRPSVVAVALSPRRVSQILWHLNSSLISQKKEKYSTHARVEAQVHTRLTLSHTHWHIHLHTLRYMSISGGNFESIARLFLCNIFLCVPGRAFVIAHQFERQLRYGNTSPLPSATLSFSLSLCFPCSAVRYFSLEFLYTLLLLPRMNELSGPVSIEKRFRVTIFLFWLIRIPLRIGFMDDLHKTLAKLGCNSDSALAYWQNETSLNSWGTSLE